jgi:ABC-2 type transport system ATP-binding protein
VETIRRDGTTVVLTTHHMDEAEALCDRVAIMDAGRILAFDTPPALVRALDAPSTVSLPPTALTTEEAASIDGVESVDVSAGALLLVTRHPATVLAELARRDALAGLQVRSASLEDVFLSITGRRLVANGEDADDDARAGTTSPTSEERAPR